MGRYDELFKSKDKPETQPASDTKGFDDAFAKFSTANKQNIGPNLDLGVVDALKGAYQGTQDLRQNAIDSIAEQTDLGKDIPGVGPNQDYRNVAKTGLDMVLPNITDVIPGGKAEHGLMAAMPLFGMAAKEGKVLNFAKKSEKTAEEIMNGIRKADSVDLGKASHLLNKPVLATAEEKAAQALPGAFGKVTVPGGNPSATDIRAALQQDPGFLKLMEEKSSIPASAYTNKKQAILNEIRKRMGGL